MKKKKAVVLILSLLPGLLFFSGCYKVTTLVVKNEQEVTTPVSLAGDLLPLLNKNCALSGCHSAGATKPDLSTANAFNALSVGNYIDLNDPEGSSIYLWLTGKKTDPMPLGAANNPSNINQLVLAWIKQGAKNN